MSSGGEPIDGQGLGGGQPALEFVVVQPDTRTDLGIFAVSGMEDDYVVHHPDGTSMHHINGMAWLTLDPVEVGKKHGDTHYTFGPRTIPITSVQSELYGQLYDGRLSADQQHALIRRMRALAEEAGNLSLILWLNLTG